MSVGSDIVAAITVMPPGDQYDGAKIWDVIAPFLGGASNAIYVSGATGLKATSVLAGYVSASNPNTGTIQVALPRVVTGTHLTILIRVFDAVAGPHFFLVQGITGASGVWSATGPAASLMGKSLALQVRLAHLTASPYTNYVLLGALGTPWAAPDIAVVDALVGQANVTSDWLTGWSVTKITSEASLTVDRTMAVLTAGYAFYG